MTLILLGALALAVPGPDPAHGLIGGGVGAVLGWLAAADLRNHRVPNRVVLPALVVLLLVLVWWSAVSAHPGRLGAALVGAGGAGLALLVLSAATRGGVGLGDVKAAALVGLWAGWLHPWGPAVALAAAFVTGGFAVAAGRAAGRISLTDRVPLVPALAVGAAVATWWTRWGI